MNSNTTPAPSLTPLPAWIDDEETLRDEGVVFGLSGEDDAVQRKADAIRQAFALRSAEVQRRRNALTEALADATAKKDAVEEEIEQHRAHMSSPDEPGITGGDAPDVAPHYFLRYLVGLALAFGLCALNYVLIYELVAPAFEQPWYVAAGVLMAGMFALFQPSSLLYNNDDDQGLLHDAPAELWKQRVSEFGVPLAAALFAVVWRLQELAWYESSIAFLFVFMLFLFGGKLFLSMIPQLSIVTRNVLRDRRIRSERASRTASIEKLRRETIPERNADITRLRDALHALPSEAELDAQLKRTISVFMSEVELARNTRDRYSSDSARLRSIHRA